MAIMLMAIRAAFGFSNEPYQVGEAKPFYEVARPGFWGGFGSYLDVFSPMNWNYANIPADADYDTFLIALDWYMVGHDMRQAIEQVAA